MNLPPFDPDGRSADDPKTTNNGLRAASAHRVFRQYPSDCDGTERLTDLLCDLQHLAHREGWDFDDALSLSQMHFYAEARGE